MIPAPGSETIFRKGDLVPAWVQRISPPESQRAATFGAHVRAARNADGSVDVFPIRHLKHDEAIIRIDTERFNVEGSAGAPTTIHALPV